MPRPLKALWYWPAKRSVTRWLVRIWILRTALSCSRGSIPATGSITRDRGGAQNRRGGWSWRAGGRSAAPASLARRSRCRRTRLIFHQSARLQQVGGVEALAEGSEEI